MRLCVAVVNRIYPNRKVCKRSVIAKRKCSKQNEAMKRDNVSNSVPNVIIWIHVTCHWNLETKNTKIFHRIVDYLFNSLDEVCSEWSIYSDTLYQTSFEVCMICKLFFSKELSIEKDCQNETGTALTAVSVRGKPLSNTHCGNIVHCGLILIVLLKIAVFERHFFHSSISLQISLTLMQNKFEQTPQHGVSCNMYSVFWITKT